MSQLPRARLGFPDISRYLIGRGLAYGALQRLAEHFLLRQERVLVVPNPMVAHP